MIKETEMNTHKGYRIFCTLICLTLALALTIGTVKASPTQQAQTDFAAIDAYVTEQMNNLGIPGMALGIVQDGQIVHLQGFGVADSSGRVVTPQTPFYIGSVSKSFTALAVMQLVEAGKIDLDAPVQTYLPWFELADKAASAQITVRHLLNQTTGISTKDGMRFWTSPKGLDETVRGLNTIQLTQPVGTTFQYSNINYGIAGLIVEKVSGQSYADYVTQHVFEPLDMRHSFATRTPALADGVSEGHVYMFGRAFSNEGVVPPSSLPSGFLIASAEDMTHYMIAQLNEGRYGDTSVLSPQGIAEMHAPAISMQGDQHYAMGWIVGTYEEIALVFHNGDSSRFRSDVILMPDRNSGLVLLANASGYEHMQSQVVDRIALGVFSLLNGKPAAPASVPFLGHFLYWTTLLTPLLQILGIVFVWRKRQGMKSWSVILTVILNLALVFFMLQLSLSAITLSTLVAFFPDVGYALVAVTTLGIGWSVIFTVMFLMKRRAK
jgi:CubicO group peptidase (beta-lactamase class C family)